MKFYFSMLLLWNFCVSGEPAVLCTQLYKHTPRRAFNVNRFLARFFSDAIAFRALEVRIGTLTSESAALQFFDRTFYPKSDLGLFV